MSSWLDCWKGYTGTVRPPKTRGDRRRARQGLKRMPFRKWLEAAQRTQTIEIVDKMFMAYPSSSAAARPEEPLTIAKLQEAEQAVQRNLEAMGRGRTITQEEASEAFISVSMPDGSIRPLGKVRDLKIDHIPPGADMAFIAPDGGRMGFSVSGRVNLEATYVSPEFLDMLEEGRRKLEQAAAVPAELLGPDNASSGAAIVTIQEALQAKERAALRGRSIEAYYLDDAAFPRELHETPDYIDTTAREIKEPPLALPAPAPQEEEDTHG